jgi:hypothetical protein
VAIGCAGFFWFVCKAHPAAHIEIRVGGCNAVDGPKDKQEVQLLIVTTRKPDVTKENRFSVYFPLVLIPLFPQFDKLSPSIAAILDDDNTFLELCRELTF